MQSPRFESAIVKIQGGEESELSAAEMAAVRRFRLTRADIPVVGDSNLPPLDLLVKRQKMILSAVE